MSIIGRVVGATAIITFASAINRLFSIIAAPILTRLLGPVPYGVMALVGTATSLTATVSLLGIDMGYVRFYFSRSMADGERVEAFCWRYALSSSVIVAVISMVFWLMFVGGRSGTLVIAFFVGLCTMLLLTNTMSLAAARIRERYRRIGWATILSGLTTTGSSIFLATIFPEDDKPLLIGFTLGTAVSIMAMGVPNLKVLLRRSGLTRDEKWGIIRLGLPGVVTGVMYWALSSLDRWFLKAFWGEEAVGIYSFAFNVAVIGLIVNSALVITWFPEITRAYEERKEAAFETVSVAWQGMALVLCLVWLVTSAVGGDMIRWVADLRFQGGASYVPWIAGGVYFYGMAQLANTGLFLSKNMTPVGFLWFVTALLSTGINFFVIKVWGGYGAAVIYCLSFAVIFGAVTAWSQRVIKLKFLWRKLFVGNVTALMCGLGINQIWWEYPLLSIAIKLPFLLLTSLLLFKVFLPGSLRTNLNLIKGSWRITVK